MREWFVLVSEFAILLIDTIALAVIVAGTLQALVSGARVMFDGPTGHLRREVWLRYARWLIAGLTFQLAADFLERDLAEVRERQKEGPPQEAQAAPARG